MESQDDRYTPGLVWSVFVGTSEDVEEALDVWAAWGQLPPDERTFIYAIARGWSADKVMKTLGMTGNQTRVKRDILTRLTRILNGEEGKDGKEVRTGK